MRHKSIRKTLLRYLDQELSERESREVQHHLENCQSCQEALKDLKAWWQPDRPIAGMIALPFLWTRISMRLKSVEKSDIFNVIKDSLFPILRPLVIIVGLLLVLLGGIELGNRMTFTPENQVGISIDPKMDNFGMNYFEVLPPGSIDARVLTLTESEMY
jgi:hypothetical protein